MAEGFWPEKCVSCNGKLTDPMLSQWDKKTPICGHCFANEMMFKKNDTLSVFWLVRAQGGDIKKWFKTINEYNNPQKRKDLEFKYED